MSKKECKYVYMLPYKERKELCDVLFIAERWKELAGNHMKYTVPEINRLASKEDPPDALLTKWGQKNGTINQLFFMLRDMQHYQAMSVILRFVDPKYHSLFYDVAMTTGRIMQPEQSMNLSTEPIPLHKQMDQMSFSSSSRGACGGIETASKKSHDTMNMQHVSSLSKPCYNKFQSISTNSGSTSKKSFQQSTDKKVIDDDYFDSNKWTPEKKSAKSSLFSMEDNMNLNLAHTSKIGHNIGAEQSDVSANAKILNITKRTMIPDNVELSIRSNDSRVRKSSREIENALHSTKNIDYQEILSATNNFDQTMMIGSGGFGQVYRGHWMSTDVAIKRLKQKNSNVDTVSEVSMNQSLIELKSLINYRHDNILPLYGVSIGGREPCLVYQYMVNGSLEDRLQCRDNKSPLLWSSRAKITQGTARGIQFLHTSGAIPLIHGDIKSANILLDCNLEPKIGDFGLAREGPAGHYTHVEVSSLHGTQYYLPPEYLRNRKLSTKVDTYSFGIVLFEVGTGLRAFDSKRTKNKLLLEHVKDSIENIHVIRDRKAGEKHSEWFTQLVNIGQECTHQAKSKRPEMIDVLRKLQQSWQEEEMKERGRKMSRDGENPTTINDYSPLSLQAYYDEQKKKSLAPPSIEPLKSPSNKPISPQPNLNISPNYNHTFVPQGPPSHYNPPNPLSFVSEQTNDYNNSLPQTYFEENSSNIPYLTQLGVKTHDDNDNTASQSLPVISEKSD